ncbi:DUF3379 domain-containing protein [Photobacterium sanctipauli]|uniref:DUF3379 domain-containing protein n=1 Tax=Photobacterium sanctipauli TaxID=1342794 RepID=A0A2T3NRG9_9GAMM|nr:DUF3379 domain-containing protein [Photobacterium sanctipauli]PSW18832.1 DUF3379 domain-containing protein [Photobacterium sanctipauli]
MDDLEFRRRLLADPNDNSQEMIAARNASVTNRKLSDELLQLDSKLEQALKVDVPDDLADRILFHQSGQTAKKPNKTRVHLALAASVAFAFGVFTGQFNNIVGTTQHTDYQAELAQTALEHIYHEAPFIEGINESVSLRQVNAKLTPFGPKLTGLPGHVYYINHCGFGNKNALHMVMGTDQGKVTVFIVPENSPQMTPFGDDSMQGVVMPIKDASLIVVGENGQDVTPIAKSLEADLNWEI